MPFRRPCGLMGSFFDKQTRKGVMMNEPLPTREFPFGVVVSAFSGRLLNRKGFREVLEFFEFVTDAPAWMPQYNRLVEECRAPLLRQFPWLRDITLPPLFRRELVSQWRTEQEATYGQTLVVTRFAPNQRPNLHPVAEINRLTRNEEE